MDTSNKNIDAIVSAYLPKVRNWVAFKLPDNPSAHDDLVQEIMMSFVENLQRGIFSERSNVRTYLFGIANNKIRDYLKYKKVRRGNTSSNDLPASQHFNLDQIESDERADRRIEYLERAMILKRVIQSMKPKYRDVLHLYYYEQLTIDEIAKRLGIQVKQAYNYMTYALTLLRNRFKQLDSFKDLT